MRNSYGDGQRGTRVEDGFVKSEPEDSTPVVMFPGWQSAPSRPRLDHRAVHVWRTRLDIPPLQMFDVLLNVEERRRADRFRFATDRHRFVAARAALRIILGGYLDMLPENVEFSYGVHGKPSLGGAAAASQLVFNISHSGDVALYAVASGRMVGVDVERVRPVEARHIVDRFFCAREAATFRQLPDGDVTRAFFECWTRKEAILKAVGDGLVRRLDEIEVSVGLQRAPALLTVGAGMRPASEWSLVDLPIDGEYVAALAVDTVDLRLCGWDAPSIGGGGA